MAGAGDSERGLHLERTQLSWRRTGLATVVGLTASWRLMVAHYPVAVSTAVGLTGAALLGVSLYLGERRQKSLADDATPGALPLLLLSGGVFAVGAACAFLAMALSLAA